MDATQRLSILSRQMHLEHAEDFMCNSLSSCKKKSIYTSRAVLPNGKQISLLKSLLTSVCERDCYYCPLRAGRDFRRATFKPDEFAKLFMTMYNSRIVDGVFLSSGLVGGGIRTQDQLLATAEILRTRYKYKGYIHLKIMPGSEFSQIEKAMHIADRVSINLEAPNPDRLKLLAPQKTFREELIQPLIWIEDIRRNNSPHLAWNGRWASSVTQFVVGGAGESDLELLSTTNYLMNYTGLSRAYFSAFTPVPDTPLENTPPTKPIRQHRLYQASYLLRDYGFSLKDIPTNESGHLPTDIDPKTGWALAHIKHNSIEINCALKEELLRIPGIGPKGAIAIIKTRRERKIVSINTLRALGISIQRVIPFILIDGKKPTNQLILL